MREVDVSGIDDFLPVAQEIILAKKEGKVLYHQIVEFDGQLVVFYKLKVENIGKVEAMREDLIIRSSDGCS